ncbi:Phosphatidylserine decarboxylase [Gilliamella apicola SCGC AB-598-B02]|nr:Phosphatidylserine decarboxylase [Gilliamella apicola SCGC AB-598-B02]
MPKSDVKEFKTFNDFFARELNEDARPIDTTDSAVVMPADGVISQFGTILDTIHRLILRF